MSDAEQCISQWRQYAAQWRTVDRAKAARFAKLADQLERIIADQQCTLAIGKPIDLVNARQRRERKATKSERE